VFALAVEIPRSSKITVAIHVCSEVRNITFLESRQICFGYSADARLVRVMPFQTDSKYSYEHFISCGAALR